MKKGERILLQTTHTDQPFMFFTQKNIFYNNNIFFIHDEDTSFHAANRKNGEQYPLLRSAFRHVKVCWQLIKRYDEELCT